MRFHFNEYQFIDVEFDRQSGLLSVRAINGALIIKPQVSNHIHVEVEDWSK